MSDMYDDPQATGGLPGATYRDTRAGRKAEGRSKTQALVDWFGTDTAGVDPSTLSSFDPSAQDWAIANLARRRARQADSRGGNYDAAFKDWVTRYGKRVDDKGMVNELERKRYEFANTYAPTFDSGLEKANELMNTAAVSAEQEGMLRSQIAGQVQQAAASNLSRVGAAMGLRGMSNSPAAAALAARAAEDYDSQLVSQLRDMGLQVTDLNRDQLQKSIAAASQLAINRGLFENSYLKGETENVLQIGRETAALVQALYAQNKTFELMEKQIKEANDESFADRAGRWLDLGQGFMNLAATGASIASGAPQMGPRSAPASPPTDGTAGMFSSPYSPPSSSQWNSGGGDMSWFNP